MGCGCCRGSGQIVPEEPQAVVPTSPAPVDGERYQEQPGLEDADKKSESSSAGSGPPVASMSDELYMETWLPLDVFSKSVHEICILGKTILGDGHDRTYCHAVVEEDFEPKRFHISGFSGDPEALRKQLGSYGVGISCRKGRKEGVPNQDNIFFCRTERFTIAGVADGHGADGHWASHWVAFYTMSLIFTEVVQKESLPTEYDSLRIFNMVHEALACRSSKGQPPAAGETSDKDPPRKFDLQSTGSTLSLLVIDHKQSIVTSAWVGDSRSVMFTLGENATKKAEANLMLPSRTRASGIEYTSYDEGTMAIVSLTIDHDPRDIGERQRILSNGGMVNAHRVSSQEAHAEDQDSGLAMSRALGDLCLHSFGVIHTPGHKAVAFEKADNCIILCTDGVWEFINNEEASRLVAKAGRLNVAEATEALVGLAQERWLEQEEEEIDDLSAIVIWL